MSKARETIENKEPSQAQKWISWASSSSQILTAYSLGAFQWGYAYGRVIGWWVVSTALITAVPLLFEVKRESLLEDLERVQIGKALSEGRTPQELAMEGLSGAIDPKVLK